MLAQDAADSVEVVWADQSSGTREQLWVQRRLFGELMQVLLYRTEDAAELPGVVSLLAADRLVPLVGALVRVRRSLYTGDLAWGQYLSVSCSDLLPLEFPDEALARVRATLMGDGEIQDLRAACAVWPSADTPPGFHAPVASTTQVLIITGELDPVTPPVGGDVIARNLPNARHVVLSNTGHEVGPDAWTACVQRMIMEFLENASIGEVDATCAADPIS